MRKYSRNKRIRKKQFNKRYNFFDYQFPDDDIKENFELKMDEMQQLFSYVGRINHKIKVGRIDAIGAVNGKYTKDITNFANTFSMVNRNGAKLKKTHERQAVFKILESSSNFNTLMRRIRSYMKILNETSYMWNKVWYGFYKEGAERSNETR